ncbi:TIGR02206 family membrane protein [Metabacillus litoralis]|uniref:YwaF family protein n=1 Tax=Metabacillus litoralis TaxID=152268 RepID=UPI001CFD4AA6|nr:TIGR02206 family membrane protein [Metabacillus litoralis]
MEGIFLPQGNNEFTLFSVEHILTLFIFILLGVSIFIFRHVLRKERYNFVVRLSFFITMIISELSLHIWLYWYDSWTYQHSLPLHLSSITLLLSAIMLLTKRYSLFEFTYFAGIGSALQAMITPDISHYTFPHYRYVHFFIAHGITILANLFMVIVNGFYPKFISIWKAFLWLNAYAILIFLINLLVDGNYMYVSYKPINPTMIDYFGPWPWYIIPLEFVAIGTFLLLYLPFVFIKLKRKKSLS